jgi:hypothetical protein
MDSPHRYSDGRIVDWRWANLKDFVKKFRNDNNEWRWGRMTQKPEFTIHGQAHRRVKYGEEATDWGASSHACSSCGAGAGEFHHAGCFVERCPVCAGQAVSCCCDYQESFPRYPMSTARKNFYKVFYLVLLPMGLIGLLISWVQHDLPLVASVALVVGIPILLTILFWNKLGEMEMYQIITTRKDRPS